MDHPLRAVGVFSYSYLQLNVKDRAALAVSLLDMLLTHPTLTISKELPLNS